MQLDLFEIFIQYHLGTEYLQYKRSAAALIHPFFPASPKEKPPKKLTAPGRPGPLGRARQLEVSTKPFHVCIPTCRLYIM